MNKKLYFQRAKKSISAITLGIILAQGLTMLPTKTKASISDGCCIPKVGYICSSDGINYSDHEYISGSEFEVH